VDRLDPSTRTHHSAETIEESFATPETPAQALKQARAETAPATVRLPTSQLKCILTRRIPRGTGGCVPALAVEASLLPTAVRVRLRCSRQRRSDPQCSSQPITEPVQRPPSATPVTDNSGPRAVP